MKNLDAERAAYSGQLRRSVRRITSRLRRLPGVERASLFGSYARGSDDLFTDLDVLVVMSTEKPFAERLRELYSLLAGPVDIDIVCYTPAEFKRLKNGLFLKHALRKEVVIYEKKRPRGRLPMA